MTNWTELDHPVVGQRFRYKMQGTDNGMPSKLEMERLERSVDEWVPVHTHNFLDGFRLGFKAAVKEARSAQGELGI